MFFKNLILSKLLDFTFDYILSDKKKKLYDISLSSKEDLMNKADCYAEYFINPVKENMVDKIYQKGITPKGKYFGQQFALQCVNKFSKNMSFFSYNELLSEGEILFHLLNKIEQDDLLESIIKLKHNLTFQFPHENQLIKDMNNFSYTILEETLENSKTRHLEFIINTMKNTKI